MPKLRKSGWKASAHARVMFLVTSMSQNVDVSERLKTSIVRVISQNVEGKHLLIKLTLARWSFWSTPLSLSSGLVAKNVAVKQHWCAFLTYAVDVMSGTTSLCLPFNHLQQHFQMSVQMRHFCLNEGYNMYNKSHKFECILWFMGASNVLMFSKLRFENFKTSPASLNTQNAWISS